MAWDEEPWKREPWGKADIARILDPPPSDCALRYTDNASIPEELSDYFQKLLSDCGLQYKVSRGSIQDFSQFYEEYDPFHIKPSDEEFMSGSALLSRWRMTPEELANSSLRFPVRIWHKKKGRAERVNDKITQYSMILEFEKDPRMWIDRLGKTPPNIWFSVPQWWLCTVEDIKFYEKLEQAKGSPWAAELPETPDWLSPKEVLKRWDKTLVWLESKVREMMLPVYSLSSYDGRYKLSEDALSRNRGGGFFFSSSKALLDDCLFRIEDIKNFEKAHPSQLKPKKPKSRRSEDNPNFKRAIDFSKSVRRKFPRIKMDDLAWVTYFVLTYGDRSFDDEKLGEAADEILEEKYGGARELKRNKFIGKTKPQWSTVRRWFRHPKAFPHKSGKPRTDNR
jgi:hypothetical protein